MEELREESKKKDKQIDKLKSEVRKLKTKTLEIKKKEEDEEEMKILSEKEGYPQKILLFIKKNLKASLTCKRLKKLIFDYSKHKDAKPQKNRMAVIKEIISTEKFYLQNLNSLLKNFYHPILNECKIFTFFFLFFYFFIFLFFIFLFFYFSFFIFYFFILFYKGDKENKKFIHRHEVFDIFSNLELLIDFSSAFLYYYFFIFIIFFVILFFK